LPKHDKIKRGFLNRYQLKIALSYLVILVVMLALLNTYPMWVSQNFMFSHTREAMAERAALMNATLSDLDSLTNARVARVMGVLDNQPQYRVIVTDSYGLAVYDNLTSGAVVGRYALAVEIADALAGQDVFHSSYKNAAFDSRFATPIISGGEVMGVLYLGRLDTAQGGLLSGLHGNLLTVSILIFAVVILFSVVVAVALTRRISIILRGIRAAYGGDYAYEIPVRGGDDLTEVAGRLNQLFAILRQTEESRQRFVSDASHELKTPLAAVRLLTDSILETPDMPAGTVREFVSDIGAETDRLSHMTEKLMQLSRLDTRPQEEPAEIDPAAVARRVARMLKPLAKKAGVAIHCELAEGCRVSGAEDDLVHVIYNLLDNAVKYTAPGGQARLSLSCGEEGVCLVITDTGVGIPEDELPRIFDRFYRVDKARSREAGGVGLGLSIVAEAAARLGGTIAAESEVGKGSKFTVRFSSMSGLTA
jgi:signal transduction histidine kinase